MSGDVNIHFSDYNTPIKKKKENNHRLEWWKFTFIIYFLTCGGGFGSEQMIKSGGVGWTFFLLVVIPFMWSLPISVVVSELGSAFPSNAGIFNWVFHAFGLGPSFVTAIIYWVNYVFSTSLYPVLFLAYLSNLSEFFGGDSIQLFFGVLIIAFVGVSNILGIEYLGQILSFSLCFQLVPFIIIFFWSFFSGKIAIMDWITNDIENSNSGTDFMMCVQLVIWSFSGYEAVGSLVEEIKDPSINLPKALIASNLLSVCIYLFSFIGALGFDSHPDNWSVGYFQDIALLVGGKRLRFLMILVAMISTLGSFNALLFTTYEKHINRNDKSQQLATLGEKQFLDIPLLALKHSTYNTPFVAIIINSVIIFSNLCLFSFDFLLKMNNLFYGFIVLLICICMVTLRFHRKDIARPLVLVQSDFALIILLIPPCILSLFCIFNSLHTSTTTSNFVVLAFFIGSIGLYRLSISKKLEEYLT